MIKSRFILMTALLASAAVFSAGAQESADLFPFQPTHDNPGNITNVRTWDGVSGSPAGSDGFIAAQGDHFIDGNGRERRFIGTNIGMTGCFPSHEDAEKVAKELSRYGVNIVRMHYVSHKTPEEGYPEKDSFIEPVQLERFDYLFAKLKEQGIYVYFQLNIARKASKINGLENPGMLPYYKNGLDNFEYVLVNLQKKFHKEILNHVNPYTGIAYKDDPAIGMFELANENSIVNSWYSPKHKFPNLVEPYKTRMREMWNDFLRNKYGDTEGVKKAWGAGQQEGNNKVIVSSASDKEGWLLQTAKGVKAEMKLVKSQKKDKAEDTEHVVAAIEDSSPDKAIPKIYMAGFSLKEAEQYCLKVKMRANRDESVTVRIGQRNAPYKSAGLLTTAKVTGQWKEFTFNFVSSISDNDLKVTFSNFSDGTTVEMTDLRLHEGMEYEWPAAQSLEQGNVDWPYPYNRYVPWQRAVDFAEFLAGIETEYFSELYNNVKDNLGVRQNVTGTQLAYGFNLPQAETDYCDIHDYWCHPSFPGGKWDWNWWQLRNNAIVNSLGSYGDNGCPGATFVQMARSRILGKPFTVSEYDHPNLNFYSAEGDIMLSAMGAFQNWSALMQFAWILDTDFDRSHVNGMFDMCSAPQKLAHFPACYAMFVRGDVRKGSQAVTFALPSSYERDIAKVAMAQAAKGHREVGNGLMKSLPLAVVSGRELKERPDLFNPEGRTVIRDENGVPEALKSAYANRLMKSSTGELTWDWTKPDAGVFMADTRKTKVFSGFVRGRSFTFNGMRLTPGRSRLDWLTLSLTQARADGNSRGGNLLSPGTYLLAATGVVMNTGQKTVEIKGPGGRISTSEKDGGSPGTGPVLCEGIEAELAFAGLRGRVSCHALGPDGSRICEVPVGESPAGEALLNIGPQYHTIWYELTVKGRENK